MESPSDSLLSVPIDVFEQCITPFFDGQSVVALASSCHRYYDMFLTNDSFSRDLWKILCKRRWKFGRFRIRQHCSEASLEDNHWLKEYRRRGATDIKTWNFMKELIDITDLDQNEEKYSRFVTHGMDAMDLFQKKKGSIEWQFEKMPEAIEKGLIRFHICQKLRLGDSLDPLDNDVPLEYGAIWIVQYLFARFSDDPSTRTLEDGTEPESFLLLQPRVESELDALAQILLQRLHLHVGENDDQHGGINQNFPLRLVLEEMKYLFDAQHVDRQKSGNHVPPFCGNTDNYYSYHNSMIHTILSTRTGIPITLAIIYSAIVRRATGIQLRAVNLPGHFMISANVDDVQGSEILFVDAFHGGKIMTESEVSSMITSAYNIRWNQNYLSTVPNIMVWKRVAMNLINSFDLPNELRGQVTSLIAMGFNHNGIYDIKGEKRLLLLIYSTYN